MKKYGFSAGGILNALNQLIWQGLMSPSELAERWSLAKTFYMPVFECRSCGDIQCSGVEKCPRCGTEMKTLSGEKSDFNWKTFTVIALNAVDTLNAAKGEVGKNSLQNEKLLRSLY